jgi:hypothetical protein
MATPTTTAVTAATAATTSAQNLEDVDFFNDYNMNFGEPDQISPQQIAERVRGEIDDATRLADREHRSALLQSERDHYRNKEGNRGATIGGTKVGGDGGGGDDDDDDDDDVFSALTAILASTDGDGSSHLTSASTTTTTADTTGQDVNNDDDTANSVAPMDDLSSRAVWRQFTRAMARSVELETRAKDLSDQAELLYKEADENRRKGTDLYKTLNVGTVGGRPTPEDWRKQRRLCRFPRVAAIGGAEWQKVATSPGDHPTTVSIDSIYDIVDAKTRYRMLQAAGAGASPNISSNDAILALLAREYDQLPQTVAFTVNSVDHKDDYTSVHLSRAALVQILRYALAHYGEINSEMLDPNVTRAERTRTAYGEMMAHPGQWGVSPDLYRLAEFVTLVNGPMSVVHEVLVQRIPIVGVILRCFYGGHVLLTDSPSELRLMPDDVLSAMQHALRSVAERQQSHVSLSTDYATLAPAADALLAGCGVCGGQKLTKAKTRTALGGGCPACRGRTRGAVV